MSAAFSPNSRLLSACRYALAGALSVAAMGCTEPAAPSDTVSDGLIADADSATKLDTTPPDIRVLTNDAGEDAEQDAEQAGPGVCAAWAAAVDVGKVEGLSELSGLARSVNGWLWAHNDSGETEARVMLLDPTAKLRAILHIPNVTPIDWEDMAAGPCGDASRCLWMGDIGDNGNKRSSVSVVRVREPASLATTPPAAGTVTHWTATPDQVQVTHFRYPDDGSGIAAALRPDAEALAVLSDGRLLVATKRGDGHSRLYRVTPPSGGSQKTVVAVLLGVLDLRDPPMTQGISLQVTGADLVGDRRLLVRCYYRAWAFDVATPLTRDDATVQAALATAGGPVRTKLPTGFDIQGESIAGDAAGGFWHTSELVAQPLWHVPCSL